MTKERPTHYT